MNHTTTVRLRRYDPAVGHYVDVDYVVHIEIDMPALADALGAKAAGNRSGKTRAMHGTIKATARRAK